MQYAVEAIVDKKIDKKTKKPLYLVKWQGYDSCQNTWEPIRHLQKCCLTLIEEFERQRLYDLKEMSKSNIENIDEFEKKRQASKQNRRIRKNRGSMIFQSNRKNSRKPMGVENHQVMEEQIDDQSQLYSQQMGKLQNYNKQAMQQKLAEGSVNNSHYGLLKTHEFQPQYDGLQGKTKNILVGWQKPQKNSSFSAYVPPPTPNQPQPQPTPSTTTFQPLILNPQPMPKPTPKLPTPQLHPKPPKPSSIKDSLTELFNNITQLQQNNPGLSNNQMKEEKKIERNQMKEEKEGREKGEEEGGVEVLGMRRAEGKLVFYVQSREGRSWRSHELMLEKYSRELCEFYEQHLDFE